ncbi:MAG TPA: damage-inducible mutagenesis protein [Geminicoccaceae bacterium]|nr:damage-inducible mutagenesis protein [Geminicoccaceae bacterium]
MPPTSPQVNPQPPRADRRRRLERLRMALARLERPAPDQCCAIPPLGLAGIDRALPDGGLPRGRLHELCGAASPAAALGFATALLARLLAGQGHAVWIGPRADLFAPGLAAFGLAPERLILVRARVRDAGLWAFEEALRSPGLVAALAEVDQLSLTQSRRLQLAAEAKGVTALLLRPRHAVATPSAATTRWRIAAAPSQAGGRDLGPPRWRVELVRCRGGRTGVWQVEWQSGGWREIEDPLLMAAEPGDRPAAPARRQRPRPGQARGRQRA